jgi:hypothetical protein
MGICSSGSGGQGLSPPPQQGIGPSGDGNGISSSSSNSNRSRGNGTRAKRKCYLWRKLEENEADLYTINLMGIIHFAVVILQKKFTFDWLSKSNKT